MVADIRNRLPPAPVIHHKSRPQDVFPLRLVEIEEEIAGGLWVKGTINREQADSDFTIVWETVFSELTVPCLQERIRTIEGLFAGIKLSLWCGGIEWVQRQNGVLEYVGNF